MATEYQIYNDAPIPTIKKSRLGQTEYPFVELEVNASFFIPPEKEKTLKVVRMSCYHWGKKLERKFKCALLTNGNIQVWRES